MSNSDLISRAAAIAEVEEYLQGLDSCISGPNLKLDGYRNGLHIAINELKGLPVVVAIPVEWLYKKMCEEGERGYVLHAEYIKDLIGEWQKEQEAQDG